ncbi:MAG TPA: trehalose-6-phosphate synthase [Bacteroidales bacterium]|nr:trehalose-6-phosphate synthase [Bacteroidales bacterium]
MRLSLTLVLSIFFGVGLVTLGFAVFQISGERSKLENELQTRIASVSDEVSRDTALFSENTGTGMKKYLIDSLMSRYYLAGIAIFYTADSVLNNSEVEEFVPGTLSYLRQSMATGVPSGKFIETDEWKIYEYIRPNPQNGASVVLYSEAGYIKVILSDIIYRNLLRWLIQAIVISVLTLAVIKWGIFNPINRIVNWTRAARSGKVEEMAKYPPANFLVPLHNEIINITKEMQLARISAEEEARLRSKGEAIWTPERLKAEVQVLLSNRKMIVVSNREPYMHIREGSEIKCIVPASGLITAMEPILNACGGLWIASGTGNADRETVDENGKIQVPPEEPTYTLRRLWQTKEEEIHYYYGFSNEGLWPLCHIAHTRPVFRMEDWLYYKKVNEDFAAAVLEETVNDKQPFILIQDYHFALLPELIRKGKPDARIAIFWHIPWPNPESFGICPWQREILRGMLSADLIGFHTQYHCNHFLETVTNALESRVGWDNFSVKMSGHTTYVKPFPISIEFTLKDYYNEAVPSRNAETLLRENGIPARYMGIGVDRIDYTKGIIEKFLGVERFLEKNPSYKGKFTFVQIGAPSRVFLKNYSDTMLEVEREAERINNRFKGKNWKPILLLERHHSHDEIFPYYAAADFCMVSSLHDGMNLVAKEYVATRSSNTGALILSRFTGASQELFGALIINPYDIEHTADTIKYALEMDPDEQKQRMTQMRQAILKNNIYTWASDLLRTMATLNPGSDVRS